jgi:hypothetical protein
VQSGERGGQGENSITWVVASRILCVGWSGLEPVGTVGGEGGALLSSCIQQLLAPLLMAYLAADSALTHP